MHPTRAKLYEQVFKVFSSTVAHLPYSRRLGQDCVDNLSGFPQLPESYRLFLNHTPQHLPGGWEMLGLDDGMTATLASVNRKLEQQGELPAGWVYFANVSDDAFYFFRFNQAVFEDAEVLCADSDGFDDLEAKSKVVAPTFAIFLMHYTQKWIAEQKQAFERLEYKAEQLGQLLE